ncbi:MAG: hypothetical protein DWQ10_00460 [Calditrichaeota bacterium]|nr:MAG: hypothetical protein DWQ10_00460 [Calditrichota bacterium]
MIAHEIDELSLEYSSSMQMLDKQLARLLEVKQRSQRKIDRINAELANNVSTKTALQKTISERTKRLKLARRKLTKIELEKKKLMAYVARNKAVVEQVRKKIDELVEKTAAAEQVISAEYENIEATEPLVETLISCRSNLLREYDSVKNVVWEKYTDRFAHELAKVSKIDRTRARFKHLLQNFRKACAGDRDLAYLWKTRTEWRKALQQIGPGEISKQISNEIALIDHDLDARYGGIVKWTKPRTIVTFEEFLYTVEVDNEDYLLLPVSREKWDDIVAKNITAETAPVAEFLGLILQEFDIKKYDADILDYKGQLLLKIERSMHLENSLHLKFPAGTLIRIPYKSLPLINFIYKLNETSFSEVMRNELIDSHGSEIGTNGITHTA